MPWPVSLVLLVLALTHAKIASASLCEHYKENKSAIHYQLICIEKSKSKIAGANSSFSSAFNLNVTALPTEPSSYGLEVIGSQTRSTRKVGPVFSLVKGFKRFGTGISTAGNNTFYGDDVVQRESGKPNADDFKPDETEQSGVPNLNFGTGFSLVEFSETTSLKLGTSVRFNKTTAKWGGGPAIAFASPYITVGAAASRERVSNKLEPIHFYTLQGTVRFGPFEFEHDRLFNNSDYRQTPIQICTLSGKFGGLVLTAGVHWLDYYREDGTAFQVRQEHYAVQYLLTELFAMGVLYNYIPGSASLGIQIYL